MAVREKLLPWDVLPQEVAQLRADLLPIGGILPGAFGYADTSGAPLTVGSGFTSALTENGPAIDSSAVNTGIGRAVSITDHPLSFVFVGAVDGTGFQCLSSIASTGDKTARIFGLDGIVRAQHIGATTFTNADAAGVWSYGRQFVAVAVFDSPTSVRVYASGNAARLSGSSTTNVGALGAMTKLSFGAYDGSVLNQQHDGRTNLSQWFRTAFSDSFAWQVLDNPALIFEPDIAWFPVSAVGGPTPVTPTDAAATYNVIGSVQSDRAATYGIAQAVSSETVASYSILAATAVASSATGSYNVIGAVASDKAAAYSVKAAIESSASANYNVIGAVASDKVASYAIKAAVASDASASYSILSASAVASSTTGAYNVIGAVGADASASYGIKAAVQSDAGAAFGILAAIQSDRAAAWYVKGLVLSDLVAAYVVNGDATVSVRGSISGGRAPVFQNRPAVVQRGVR